MKKLAVSFALASLFLATALMGVGRRTMFVDQMEGFEEYLRRAVLEQELKLELIEESEHPDLKAMLGKRFKSVSTELMYRKNTGRTEDSTLTIVDVKTGKTLLKHDFTMGLDPAQKQRNANEFVRKVKDLLEKLPAQP